jgi:hypothetical protein
MLAGLRTLTQIGLASSIRARLSIIARVAAGAATPAFGSGSRRSRVRENGLAAVVLHGMSVLAPFQADAQA